MKLNLLLLLISDLIIIGVLLTLIIQYFFLFSTYEYIWISSKILSVNKIVENKKNGEILYGFFDSYVIFLKYNYADLLKNSTKDNCQKNFKQCGILDTYGNKLCFNESLPCPINHILVDLKSKQREYLNKGYFSFNLFNESSDLQLYYTNNKIDNPVIVDIIYSNSLPKYISYSNLILDYDAIKKVLSDKLEIEFGDFYAEYDDDGGLIKEFGGRVVEKSIDFASTKSKGNIKKKDLIQLIDYIDAKINYDENNIDKYCINIYGNYYVKNYIGFENHEKMEEFLKTDFSIYHTIFPNKTSVSFAITYLSFLDLFICLYLQLCCDCRDNKCLDCCYALKLIIYWIIFFGFFIYFLVVYCKVFKNKVFSNIKSIKSDEFITNFINEFSSPFEKKTLILSCILLFSFSALLFIFNYFKESLIECIKEIIRNIEINKKNEITECRINSEEIQLNNKAQNENKINLQSNKKNEKSEKNNQEEEKKIESENEENNNKEKQNEFQEELPIKEVKNESKKKNENEKTRIVISEKKMKKKIIKKKKKKLNQKTKKIIIKINEMNYKKNFL